MSKNLLLNSDANSDRNSFIPAASGTLSGSETVASVLLAISIFLVGLSVLSYCLSIISVGETLMFIIFKKKSDDDDLLQRKDEDELEEDDDDFSFDEDSDDLSDDSNENDDEPDVTNSGEPLDPEKEE